MRLPQIYPPAYLGMPVAGLLWSLAVLQAEQEMVAAMGIPLAQAHFLVALGGVTQFLILWLGLTAVCWAMTRALGGRLPVLRLGALISNAAFPLWIGAPALAFWLSNSAGLGPLIILIPIASLALFAILAARLLSAELNWSVSRSAVAICATLAFLASSIFLTY